MQEFRGDRCGGEVWWMGTQRFEHHSQGDVYYVSADYAVNGVQLEAQ